MHDNNQDAVREALEPFADAADELERVGAQHSLHPNSIRRSLQYDDCVRARAALATTPALPGHVLVPVEQLREWYTAAWAMWISTATDDDEDDELGPTPDYLSEMEAMLLAARPSNAGGEG